MSDLTLPRTVGYEQLLNIRATNPGEIAAAAARRRRRGLPGEGERLLIIAADHPARGSLAVRDRPLAMASRFDLLDRLRVALARPGVDGILASPTCWKTCCCSARSKASWPSAR